MPRDIVMHRLPILAALGVLAGLAQPPAAHAQGMPAEGNFVMPRCGPAMDGQVMCRFGVVYECQYVDPNSLERRTGWRWKSDILRSCTTPPAPQPRTELPPGLVYAPSVTTGGTITSGADNPASAPESFSGGRGGMPPSFYRGTRQPVR